MCELDELNQFMTDQFGPINELATLEEFSARDKDVMQVVDKCKKITTPDEFKKTIQECDLLVTYKLKKFRGDFIGHATTWLNKLIQGSAFSSIKMVGRDANEVIGYGVDVTHEAISRTTIDRYLELHEGCIIIRHNGINDVAKEKILTSMEEAHQKQFKYDVKNLFVSVYKHWAKKKDVDEQDKSFVGVAQSAMICSSILYKLFMEAGLKVQTSFAGGGRWVWPKDLLLSPSFKIVGGWFSPDAQIDKVLGIYHKELAKKGKTEEEQ